jgi:deoxyribodipyrimidine photo-lyase
VILCFTEMNREEADMCIIHWFRRDLRLQDNTALHAALKSGYPVVPLFIFDETLLHSPRVGAARIIFMLNALKNLDTSLRYYGTRLLIKQGQPEAILPALMREIRAQALYFNVDYSPYARQRDEAIEKGLSIPVHVFDDAVLIAPENLFNKQGKPYTGFTPYRKTWNTRPKSPVSDLTLNSSMFLQQTEFTGDELPTSASLGIAESTHLPEASEQAAHVFLHEFVEHDLQHYATTRNNLVINPFVTPRPQGSSYLSPYLRLGLLSPRQAYHAAHEADENASTTSERHSIETWINELAWRDFYIQVLYHFPYVLERDFKPQYAALAWDNDLTMLKAWQEGRTGYPIIDAPMRQMNAIGWMPNRARMITASFLCKDLLIHWRAGDLYFMQRLIDGDPAANNGGWQWAAGTGTDAQPFYRIFNPITQSKNFATPEYLRAWIPELQDVSDADIHTPWEMSTPPPDYPRPIVDHVQARAHTLETFRELRRTLRESKETEAES